MNDLSKSYRDRRGVAALEFAIAAPALFLFLFIIINFGLLAWTYDALHEGVVAAARYASVTTSDSLLNAKNALSNGVCASQNEVQNQFNAAVAPPLVNGSIPQVQISWGGSLLLCGVTNGAPNFSNLPGGWVQVSVHYVWSPVAMPNWLSGVNLTLSDVEPVLNAPPA